MQTLVVAFLVSVKQRRGPKMRPHSVQQPSQSQITMHAGSILNADTFVFRTHSSGPLYKHCSHDSSVALAILLLKKNIKIKQNILHLSVILHL